MQRYGSIDTQYYAYDGNGNQWRVNESADASIGVVHKLMDYDPFNKPIKIQNLSRSKTVEFSYGPNHQRFFQLKDNGPNYTTYVDKLYEGSQNDEVEKLYIGDYAVIDIKKQNTTRNANIHFLHRDRLGSVVSTSNSAGVVDWEGSRGFDPFGKPREGNWNDSDHSTNNQENDAVGDLNKDEVTTRGFTAHEHLNAVDYIHMNGRVYDYNLGRFLSVDPIIQAPANSQSLNAYSYLMNSPLSGTDPSGYQGESDTGRSNSGPTGSGSASDQRRRNVTGSHVRKEDKITLTFENGQKATLYASEFGVSYGGASAAMDNGAASNPTTNQGTDSAVGDGGKLSTVDGLMTPSNKANGTENDAKSEQASDQCGVPLKCAENTNLDIISQTNDAVGLATATGISLFNKYDIVAKTSYGYFVAAGVGAQGILPTLSKASATNARLAGTISGASINSVLKKVATGSVIGSVAITGINNFDNKNEFGGYLGAAALTVIDGAVYTALNATGPVGALIAVGYSYSGGSAGIVRTVKNDVLPSLRSDFIDINQQLNNVRLDNGSLFRKISMPEVPFNSLVNGNES